MHYNPSFVGYRPILRDEDKSLLHGLAAKYPLDRFKSDARSYEEMVVDFVYTSAKIEGNTYDRIDTDNLLRLGVTAGGKRYSDAIMLINLRDGFGKVMAVEANTELDLDYLCDLHKILMKDLLPVHEQGIVRTSAVQIGASNYRPLAGPARLRTEMKFILPAAKKYSDPFEQAIYLHCNLAYLQYFRDGNKRTSRLMQTAALVRGSVLPLFFKDTLIDKYQRATVHYYETGGYGPYISFFKENSESVIARLFGDKQQVADAHETEEAKRRITQLPSLDRSAGPAHTFWLLAQEAIGARGSAEAVNWPDVERRTMVESIAKNGQSPEGVGTAICKYSPGAVSSEKQQAILDDIKRLAPDLQKQYAKARGERG